MKNLNLETISNTIQSKIQLTSKFDCITDNKNNVIKLSINTNQKVDWLIFGFSYYNNFKMDSIVSGISFKVLNRALSHVISNISEENINIKNTISQINEGNNEFDSIHNNLPIDLKSNDDLNRAIELAQEFVDKISLPFYQKWSEPSDLLPLIENINLRDLSKVYGGNGIFEKTVTLYLYEKEKAYKFLNELLQKYQNRLEDNPDEEAYQNMIDSLEGLQSSLKNIPENINEY